MKILWWLAYDTIVKRERVLLFKRMNHCKLQDACNPTGCGYTCIKTNKMSMSANGFKSSWKRQNADATTNSKRKKCGALTESEQKYPKQKLTAGPPLHLSCLSVGPSSVHSIFTRIVRLEGPIFLLSPQPSALRHMCCRCVRVLSH